MKGRYSMKSAVFYGRHDIRIEERERPSIGAEDILIRVKACGVCDTDVHIFEGGIRARPRARRQPFSGMNSLA